MSKKNVNKQIALYGFHPHVSLVREYLGYKDEDFTNLDSDEAQDDYLRSLDPKDWRNTDHYSVLGLGNKRYKASDDEIRKAYRKRLLDHHPDKRRHRGEQIKEVSSDYFSCITKAFEILSDPNKRFAYDCVDEKVVDDSIPTVKEVKSNFYCLDDVFKRNARWSKKQPMPTLGTSSSSIQDVDKFYDEWEAFQSIRDYSYLDEEDKDRGEDREHRRYLDRLNKQERDKRNNADLKRIQKLVLLAFENDPRLEQFKLEAKKRRQEKKDAKAMAANERREQMEKQKKLEEDIIRRREEEAERARKEEHEKAKKLKEAEKAEVKKNRRQLRILVTEKWDYFQIEEKENEREKVKLDTVYYLDVLCRTLSTLEIGELNESLEKASQLQEAKSEFHKRIEKHNCLKAQTLTTTTTKTNGETKEAVKEEENTDKWTPEGVNCLVKAIKSFPAGTDKRWDVITAYLNQHLGLANTPKAFSSRETLKKAKSLNDERETAKLMKAANEKAFDTFQSEVSKDSDMNKRTIEAQITTAIESQTIRPWNVTEQKALEGALRTITPKTLKEGEDRWQKVADIVGTRTKKECMLRYKTLAEEIRAKKAAIEAAKK